MARIPRRKPFEDGTKTPPLSKREQAILRRLRAGETLYIGREYADNGGRIVNTFWWDHNEGEWDSAVWMLLRRGLIYPTGVRGGAQWLRAGETEGEHYVAAYNIWSSP